MAAEIIVSTEVAAPPEAVFALLADLPRMGEWSPECERVTFRGGATEAAQGVSFSGRNRAGSKAWSTVSTITEFVPGRAIGWEVRSVGLPVSYWGYRLEPTSTGCRVEERWLDRRGRLVRTVGGIVTGVGEREEHNRAGMQTTLARLKAAAEA